MAPDRSRAFVALRISAATAAAIASFIGELRGAAVEGVSWVRITNLHLTLRFLGPSVPASIIERLDPELRRIAASTQPFVLRANGAGVFPDFRRPRVIWIGLSHDPVVRLADRIEQAARDCGLTPDPRPYQPHLTIGRVREPRGRAQLRSLIDAAGNRDFGESLADSMVLYRSVLGSGGASYETIAGYSFQLV
jgi:2'-5' RNA ligase